MSINSSGRKLEGFFTGKGFYIVLFLCAAVIGLSAWMMATGKEAMEDLNAINGMNFDANRVETIIIPPASEAEDILPASAPDKENLSIGGSSAVQVWNDEDIKAVEAPLYIWPLQGELERSHNLDQLSYDVTLRDWRTHNGIDICAPLGSSVSAVAAGSVLSVEQDSLYGTVVSIEHTDGTVSVYANLADMPTVSEGDWVECGEIIGSVGSTALCEIGQGTHLHFAMKYDGENVNPLEYLPE